MRTLLFLFSLFIGCVYAETRPIVTVTLAPYAHIIETLAEDFLDVQILIPETSNPHLYESKPQDIKKLNQSAIWFQSGEVIEKKLQEKTSCTLVDLNKDIALIHTCSCHDHHGDDLHTWLSPKNYLIQAQTILTSLCSKFPEKKELFETHFIKLQKEINDLILKIETLKAHPKSHQILISHGAYGYLCQDLGLEQKVLEHEGKEPTLKHIQQIFESSKQNPPKILFAPIQHSDSGAKRLSSLLNAEVVYVNPYQKNYPKALDEFFEKIE